MVHEHLHQLVQRSADGTKIVPLVKRDDYSDNIHNFIHKLQHNTNGESIKLNVPAGFALKGADTQSEDTNQESNDGVAVEVKYVTASASFSGSILGFVTDTPTAAATSADTQVAAVTPASVNSAATSSALAKTSTYVNTPAVGTPQAQSRTTSSPSGSAQADSSTSNQDLSASSQNSGMTDGAKAGLAIGIILAIALVAGLFFFCWKRAKKNNQNDEYNEKQGYTEKRSSFFGAGSNGGSKRQSADSDKSFGTVHNTATAPRLSLRPVTQFLPAAFTEKRKSSMQPQMSEKSAWNRGPQNGENPFRDPAAAPAQNPFDEGDGSSQHSSKKNSWEAASAPGTPKSAQLGTAAAVPVAAMNAQGPPRVQNNVHRVQLDFKPSMDDELELKSGQLVRLLHEYDDGWALCIRMDRSQQGVAPRTCLSKTPVKPRGPPSGRTSPQGSMQGPPQSPVTRKPVPGQAI